MRRLLLSLSVVLATLLAAPVGAAWIWPVEGPVLRPFAVGGDRYAGGQHRGIDIAAPVGTEVRAPLGGVVSFTGSVPGGGRVVSIETADGHTVTLLQLGSVLVVRGAVLEEGALVG